MVVHDCCVRNDVHREVDPVARFSTQVLSWFGAYVCLWSLMDLYVCFDKENQDPSGICRVINVPASRMKAKKDVDLYDN